VQTDDSTASKHCNALETEGKT